MGNSMVIALSSSYRDVGLIGRSRSFWFPGCVLCPGCVHLEHANCVAKVMFSRVCLSVSLLCDHCPWCNWSVTTQGPPHLPLITVQAPPWPWSPQTCSNLTVQGLSPFPQTCSNLTVQGLSPFPQTCSNLTVQGLSPFPQTCSNLTVQGPPPRPNCWQVGSWHLTEMSCMCLDWYVSTLQH